METEPKFSITCSQIAVEKIKENIAKRNKPETKGIRLGLRGGGCNGYSIVMEYVDNPYNKDHIFTFNNVSIYVDPKSLVLLDGTEVDYEIGILGHGFKFRIPKEKGKCGCGSSISF